MFIYNFIDSVLPKVNGLRITALREMLIECEAPERVVLKNVSLHVDSTDLIIAWLLVRLTRFASLF
jgi:hypothetical protein